MKLKALFAISLIPTFIVIATLIFANYNDNATASEEIASSGSSPVNQDGTPIVITIEVPVTVEVTRVVTVVVTPTFTPLPPTPTPLPPDMTIDDDPFLGSADAPVKVVEFSDFQCGFCARFALTTLPTLTEHYGDLIQFVYRDYPIFGDASFYAALATECTADQAPEKFWDYHNLLFANHASEEPLPLDLSTLEMWAASLDLDTEEWLACVDNQETIDEIFLDYQTGYEWGITGTPTFFINGVKLVGAQPIEVFYDVIDAELVAAGIEPPERESAD